MQQPKGMPTNLNVWVMAEIFGAGVRAPNAIKTVDAPSLRKCIKAGLVEVDRATRELCLTARGANTLCAWAMENSYRGESALGWPTYEVAEVSDV